MLEELRAMGSAAPAQPLAERLKAKQSTLTCLGAALVVQRGFQCIQDAVAVDGRHAQPLHDASQPKGRAPPAILTCISLAILADPLSWHVHGITHQARA